MSSVFVERSLIDRSIFVGEFTFSCDKKLIEWERQWILSNSFCLHCRSRIDDNQLIRFENLLQRWKSSVTRNSLLSISLTKDSILHVYLSSNRSQMTSKCDKNKINGKWGTTKCITHVLTIFWYLLWSITDSDWTNPGQHGICLFYIKRKRMVTLSLHLSSNRS